MIKQLPYCLLLLAACIAAPAEKVALTDPELGDETEERADGVSGAARIVGALSILNGKASGTFSATKALGYTIQLQRGPLVASLTSPTGDSVLSVYGPLKTSWRAAARVGYNDDISENNYDSKVAIEIATAGKYLIVVREYLNNQSEYELTVNGLSTPLACTEADCGSRPELAQFRCPDGSFVWPSQTCGISNDSCGWITTVPVCPAAPATCQPSDCTDSKPDPAAARCPDGRLNPVTVSCDQSDRAPNGCAWTVHVNACRITPRMCAPSDCTDTPPDPVQRRCPGGSNQSSIVTCEPTGNTCAWQVYTPRCV